MKSVRETMEFFIDVLESSERRFDYANFAYAYHTSLSGEVDSTQRLTRLTEVADAAPCNTVACIIGDAGLKVLSDSKLPLGYLECYMTYADLVQYWIMEHTTENLENEFAVRYEPRTVAHRLVEFAVTNIATQYMFYFADNPSAVKKDVVITVLNTLKHVPSWPLLCALFHAYTHTPMVNSSKLKCPSEHDFMWTALLYKIKGAVAKLTKHDPHAQTGLQVEQVIIDFINQCTNGAVDDGGGLIGRYLRDNIAELADLEQKEWRTGAISIDL